MSSGKDKPAALGFCPLITVDLSSRKELGHSSDTVLLSLTIARSPLTLQEMWPSPFGLSGCLVLGEVFAVKMHFLT